MYSPNSFEPNILRREWKLPRSLGATPNLRKLTWPMRILFECIVVSKKNSSMSHGTTILMELFVVFVWAKVFAEIFEHLRIPAVLGEITAGVLLGPHAIALIKPGEFTFSIAEVGAVFLLLSVGLETRPQELIRVGKKFVGVALGGVLLPFAAGFGYILLRGYSPREATFVAEAMVATSVAVTARLL